MWIECDCTKSNHIQYLKNRIKLLIITTYIQIFFNVKPQFFLSHHLTPIYSKLDFYLYICSYQKNVEILSSLCTSLRRIIGDRTHRYCSFLMQRRQCASCTSGRSWKFFPPRVALDEMWLGVCAHLRIRESIYDGGGRQEPFSRHRHHARCIARRTWVFFLWFMHCVYFFFFASSPSCAMLVLSSRHWRDVSLSHEWKEIQEDLRRNRIVSQSSGIM